MVLWVCYTPEESHTYTSLQGILYVLKQVETVGAIGVSAYLRMLRSLTEVAHSPLNDYKNNKQKRKCRALRSMAERGKMYTVYFITKFN